MWNKNLLASKKFYALLLILLFAIVMNGCTKKQEIQKEESITFTDALDREVTVPVKPQRVAALLGSFADVWILAGGEVCAAPEDAWDDFELGLEDAINLGGAHSPSLESLLSSNPDFVIASASTAANVEMKDVLESAGIVVAYFDVDCFEDYLQMLDLCTDITERKDLYEENGLHVQNKIEDIKAQMEKEALPEEKRTILLMRAASNFVKAKGSSGTILGEMLEDLGCINIADAEASLLENLSVESVMKQEPYHIFVVTMGDDTEKALDNVTRMMEENPAWGTLEAVKENRLHVMERKLFNIKPNEKWAESYERLSEILLEKEK